MKTNIPSNIQKRPIYLDLALKFLDKDIIKLFTGQRRVGKSYMLYQVIQHLTETSPHANILYINKELPEFNELRHADELIKLVKQNQKASKNYLFIDEIQEIEDFEKALRSLLAGKKWDIWCTGSNAAMLSHDIAGKLSGCSIEIKIHSLTYLEFLQFHQLKESASAFQKYLKYGGLPYLINLHLTDDLVFEYLRGIYITILYKDIVARYQIRNTHFLENLVIFAADNTGSLISSKRISDYLKSQGINIATNRVLEYLAHLTNAFFLIKLQRAEVQGRKIFAIGEKYYFEDLGLRNSILGFRTGDISKILENAVLLHMLSHGYKVYTGVLKNKEIDFICERNAEKIYIQVAYLIPDQQVHDQEFGNLMLIHDNYPKYVLSMDETSGNTYQGIIQMNVREFLLKII